jgi:hypothetical protein
VEGVIPGIIPTGLIFPFTYKCTQYLHYIHLPVPFPHQKLLDNINSFSKVAEYKINLQNPIAFLYTNNEQTEKEYRKTIQLTIASKKKKPSNKLNKGCE